MVGGPKFRDTMPPWVLLYRLYEEARTYSGPLDVDARSKRARMRAENAGVNATCCLCGGMEQIGLIMHQRSDVYRCMQCAMLWHKECLRWTARKVGVCYPECNAPFICTICANVGKWPAS